MLLGTFAKNVSLKVDYYMCSSLSFLTSLLSQEKRAHNCGTDEKEPGHTLSRPNLFSY